MVVWVDGVMEILMHIEDLELPEDFDETEDEEGEIF